MNKFKSLLPVLAVLALGSLAACTVVEPVPATSTTTVQRETTVRTPAAASTTTTTTHSAGGY